MDGFLIDPKTPHTNTNTENTGPVWAQAIYKFGVPSVIALYLIYSLVNGGSAMLANVDRSLQAHIAETASQIKLLEDIKDSSRRMELFLQLDCIRNSKTQVDRDICTTVAIPAWSKK